MEHLGGKIDRRLPQTIVSDRKKKEGKLHLKIRFTLISNSEPKSRRWARTALRSDGSSTSDYARWEEGECSPRFLKILKKKSEKNSDFFFGFSSFSVDFRGARLFLTSKSSSSRFFALDGQIFRSVRRLGLIFRFFTVRTWGKARVTEIPEGGGASPRPPRGRSGGLRPPGISVACALPPQVDVRTVKNLKMSSKGCTDLKI